MSPSDFCYWLQGLFEVGRPTTLDATQVAQIRDHLALAMTKATPDRDVLRRKLEVGDPEIGKRIAEALEKGRQEAQRHIGQGGGLGGLGGVMIC